MSAYIGNASSETLNTSNWNYGWTSFYMSAGNDSVSTPSTGVAYFFNDANDTGYLLSDLDRNYSFETGVVIRGAGSASDMNGSNIV